MKNVWFNNVKISLLSIYILLSIDSFTVFVDQTTIAIDQNRK